MEDNEFLNEVTSIDLFPSEVKMLDSKPNQSLEVSNNEEQTASTPLAIKIKVDQENAITEAGMGTNQGESFLKSSPVPNVATDDSSSTPEVFEIETLVEEILKSQQVDIVSSKEPSDVQGLISEEKLEKSHSDERGKLMEDENVTLATAGENGDYHQIIEVSEIKEEIMSTSSEKSSYEDTHEISYNSSKVTEMESEKTQDKNEQNGTLHNDNTDVSISATDRIEKEAIENDAAVKENTGSPHVTALIEEKSAEEAEVEQGGKLSESSGVEVKEVWLNEKENEGPNVDDIDESIEEQITKKDNLGQLLESAGDETVRCPHEVETFAQKGEEFEIDAIEDIIEVEMAENKNNIQALASNTEDITAKSSPECETTRDKPEQEVPRISIKGAEDIEFQTIEQDNAADVGPSAGEEINEANLNIEVNRTDKEIEEQNIEESANKTDLPSTVAGEEIAFEKLEEDETDELKPKEEVKNLELESIESMNVESTIANMKDDLELDKDCDAQGSKGLSEEIHQKETNEDLVVSSSMPQVSQKETEDEDLDKQESAITELIEETSIMEPEQEHEPESNSSDLIFEEKSKDVFAELAEANEIGENTNIQIPKTTKIEADEADEAGEETVCELEEKTYTTTPKGEDQREVTSGETSLSCISEKTLEESSAPSITDIQLGTTEVSETIDGNAEITEISNINTQSLVTAKTTEEKLEEKEPMDPTEDTLLKLKDIQIGDVNVEENLESVEPHELRSSIELVAEEKSNETYSEASQTKTDEDKENVNKQNLEAAEHDIFLASDTASDEKIYGEISQKGQNESEEVESKSEAELQMNGAAYRIEEINDVVLTEEVLGEVEKAEESEYFNEQVADEESCATELQLTSSSDQEQNKVTSSDSVATENCKAAGIIENTGIEELQEIEDINWESEISSIAKAPEEKKEGTENPVIINRSASEPSEENIEEEDNNSLGVHAIPQGEAADNLESEDSSLRSELSTREQADINDESMAVAKPDTDKTEVEELKISDAEPIIEITETAELQEIKWEPEASAIAEASEEEIMIGTEKPINFTISESALAEVNIREVNIDEAETTAPTVMTTETSSEGVQLANQSTRDMDTTAGDSDLGFDSTIQDEAVDAMELQDSSVISELAIPEHADVNKEPMVVEKSATDEVEELKISDVEPIIVNSETEELQAVEGTNRETEASSIAKAPEEEIMKDAEKPISITSSVSELSEENTRQEEIEEVDNHMYEAETAQATEIPVETSSDGVQLANVSERSFDTTSGDNSLGSTAVLQGEAVDSMELEDSCVISQLAITKDEDANKETMVVEESATDETEVEELEISNAEPNSYQQNVHHIHESEKISTVESSDTNTHEEETYEVLERESEAVDEEITEQFQTPSYATLLGEQELQTTTTAEKVEDESTMKEETLVNEKSESTIATNPNEETCLRASEVEISTLDLELLDENDNLGESSTQETTDPQETRAEDPQVNISMIQLTDTISGGQENQEVKDIEHISFQEHSIEETLDSANSTEGNKDSPVPHSQVNGMLPEEAPYLDLQEIERVAESVSDLQRPEVLDKSEETEVKEELTQVAARESRENENLEEKLVEEETIIDDISSEKTEDIKEDAKDSSVVSLEVVHIQELAQEIETIGENKDSTDEGKAAADTYQDLNADREDNSSCPQETEKERSVEEEITTLDLQDTNWSDANAEAKSPNQEKKNPEAYEEPTSASLSMVQDNINETPLEPNKVNVDNNSSNVEEVKISEKDSKDEEIEMIDEVATESQTNQSEDCIEIIKDGVLSEEIEEVTEETGEAKKSEDAKHEFNEEEICIRELQTTSSADGTANEVAYSDPVTVEKLESKDLSLETKVEELEATEDLNLESEASPIEETSEKEVKQGTEKPANIISSVLEVSVEESGVIEYIDTQPETLKSETSLKEVHETKKLIKGSNAENQIEKADEANDTIENTHSSEKVADAEGVARTFMGTDSIEELSEDLPWIVAQEKAEENVTGAGKAIVNSNQDSVVEGTAYENLLQEAPEAKNVNELPSDVETRETVNQTDFIEISEETIVLSEENAYSDPEHFENLEATDLSVETEEDLNSESEALANEMNNHTENPVELTSSVVEVTEEEKREENIEADNITDTPAVTLLTETISEEVQQGEELNANEAEAEELITSNRALASIGQDSKDVFEIDEVQEQMKSDPESIAEEKEVANDYISSASVPIEENLETAPHEELIVTYEYVANDQSDESLLDANSKTEDSKDQNLESTVEKIIKEDFQEERSEMNEEVGHKVEEENEETQHMHETKRDVLLVEEISKEAFEEIQEVEEIVNIKEEIMDSCTEERKITSESDENLSEITISDPIVIENIEVIESSGSTEEVNLLTAEDFSGKSGADFASKAPEEDVNQDIEKSTYNINSDSVEPKPIVNKENLEKADTDMNKESEILNNVDADEIQVEESKEHDIENVHRNGETTPEVSIGEDELEIGVFETEPKYQADETVVEGGKIADLIHLATNFIEKSQESSSSEIICREQDRETTTTTKKGDYESGKEDGTLVTELEEDTLSSRTIEVVSLSKENPEELQVSQFGFFELGADKQNDNPNEAAKEERSAVEEAAAVEPQEDEDNKKAEGSLVPRPMGIPGNVGEKCVEDTIQDFQEIEEVIDFMPEAPIPSAATETEVTEIEEVHPDTATMSLMDEEDRSQIANENPRTILKEVSSDQTTVDKEVAEDFVVVSPDEEKIRGNYLRDELETLEYPEEIANQKLETTKIKIPTEEFSDELEKAGEIIETVEYTVSEHIPMDEVYQDSLGERTDRENLPEELKEENILKEAPTELKLQECGNETDCRDRNTEDKTVNEESNVSELELVKQNNEEVGPNEKSNLSQKYEFQSTDFEVSAVADVVSEEATLIDEVEVFAIAKDSVQEIIETYEAKPDVEDTSNPKYVVNEKPEQTPVESTYDKYVATESLIQTDQEKAKEFLDISQIEGKVDLTEVSEITLGVQVQEGPITKTVDDEVEELRAENDSVTELDTNRAEIGEANIMVEEKKEQEEPSSAVFALSELMQSSTKGTSQMVTTLFEESEPTDKREDRQPDKAQTDDSEGAQKKDKEGHENQKVDSGSDAPDMIEVARDVDVKVQKKSHGILSGVGSKVKHSISKVKKVITGKSSHPKTSSPN